MGKLLEPDECVARIVGLGDVRTGAKTQGLTRICTDETDLRTGKSNDEIQGAFTPFRMTTRTATGDDPKQERQNDELEERQTVSAAVFGQVLRDKAGSALECSNHFAAGIKPIWPHR
jgi:hypothetical protein